MCKLKSPKVQKLKKSRIQKITFIGMAILMGIVQYLAADIHDYKLSLGEITITIRV